MPSGKRRHEQLRPQHRPDAGEPALRRQDPFRRRRDDPLVNSIETRIVTKLHVETFLASATICRAIQPFGMLEEVALPVTNDYSGSF